MINKEQIWGTLKTVTFPGFDRNILGAVQNLEIDEETGTVTIDLAIAHLGSRPQQAISSAVREAIEQVEGVEAVHVYGVQRRMPEPAKPEERVKRPHLPNIRHVVAVGSGKGGVGKSTVAVNLAMALAQQGQRVGLMDADIFGPNIPRMVGVEELPPTGERGMVPAEIHGVKLISVGFLVEPEKAVVWRGPMTDKLLRQFLHNVEWGELDTLVVDLPPGTGDIALSLGKHAQPDGAIVVVTPQAVASDDARKAIGMFRRLDIPVLGVVENMSYFLCDECGTRHHLFGAGGGQALADEMDIPLLGQIPFEPLVREGGDIGEPAALRDNSLAGAALQDIAQKVRQALEAQPTP
ncbi:MAG: Mrp/NBP35 family ATP-binding protein [Chloroflexota bacterium]|nr:Mrp/NBP35 family ATP-binding protein [Chloroflexota bacterium]